MICIIYPDVDLWNFVLQGNLDGVIKRPLNKFTTKIQQFFRKLDNKHLTTPGLILGKALRKDLSTLSDGDVLIIADYMDRALLLAISRVVKETVTKYLWIWNPLTGAARIKFLNIQDIISSKKYIASTFDSQDADKYGIELRPQFFKMSSDQGYGQTKYDFYFMGFDKGRQETLTNIQSILQGYQCEFRVVHNLSEYIDYKTYLNNARYAKCLVDIVQDGQSGLSLRPLEAMALGKKLLTNNHFIKEYDFYDPNCIFIIGDRDWAEINSFLNSPFHWNQSIIRKYDVLTWLYSFRVKSTV